MNKNLMFIIFIIIIMILFDNLLPFFYKNFNYSNNLTIEQCYELFDISNYNNKLYIINLKIWICVGFFTSFYLSNWDNIVIKTSTFFLFIISVIDIFYCIFFSVYKTQIRLILDSIIPSLIIITFVFKNRLFKSNINLIQNNEVYILINKPKGKLFWILNWFGISYGFNKIIISHNNEFIYYGFSNLDKKYYKSIIKNINSNDCFLIRCKVYNIDRFIYDCDKNIGKKWNFFINNCNTVLRIPFYNQGIDVSVFDYIPNYFLNKIII